MTILASVNNKTVMPGITPIADVPDTPTIGTATAAGLAASITFTAATTGGTPTTFTATSNPGSITGTASSSPVTVSGLTDGTSYTFTVTAGNSTGTSPASSASNSITAVSPISGGYDALATVIVPSGGLSSITFAGIPTGYKHLELRVFARINASLEYALVTFNSDVSANYSEHHLSGNGSTIAAGGNANYNQMGMFFAMGMPSAANTFGIGICSILDYANTNKYKTIRSIDGFDSNGSGAAEIVSGSWRSFSAVNSISITPNSGSLFAQYTNFSLYGVR